MPDPAFPDWIVPMAATLTQDRFAGPDWTFERKYDGIRLLAFRNGDDVRLYSRNRLLQNFPPVAAAIGALPARQLILDGEITWREPSLTYHVFDLLWIDGDDMMQQPIEERRARLAGLPFRTPLERVPLLDEAEPWDRACREGWEGVIAKRRGTRYEHRRSPHWLKMKCEVVADLTVGGFTDPQGARVGLGSLLVGHHKDGAFTFAGRVGTGFDTKLLLALRACLDGLEIPKPPFEKAVGLPRLRAHWVRPEVIVRVAFIEWTGHGKLRHPRLLSVVSGLAADRGAR